MSQNTELDVGEWLPLEDLYMKAFGLIIYKKEKEEWSVQTVMSMKATLKKEKCLEMELSHMPMVRPLLANG